MEKKPYESFFRRRNRTNLHRDERSIDLAVVKPSKVRFIKIDVGEVKHIRDRYFGKRGSIQSKTWGRTRAKLLAKYSGEGEEAGEQHNPQGPQKL